MPNSESEQPKTENLQAENAALRERLEELELQLEESEATLAAIRSGDADALVVERDEDADIFSLAASDGFYFQLAQQAANVGTWDWDLESGRMVWSDGIFSLLGISREQFRASNDLWWQAVHPEDRLAASQKLEALLASDRENYYDELRIVRPDGDVRWVAVKGKVLRRTGSSHRRFVGINLDITDRKAVEEALRVSEAKFRQVADAMPQILWSARPDGTTDYYNERWYEFTGLDRDRRGEESFRSVLHPDDVGRCVKLWSESVRSGEPYNIEYRFWDRTSNSYRWFLGRALPIYGDDGEISQWFGTATDIHDIKSAHDKVRQSEEALREADRRKNEFLAMLAHELRNPLAAISNSLQLTSMPGVDDEDRQWATDVMQRQIKALTHIIDDLLDVSRITRDKIKLRKERLEVCEILRRAVDSVQALVDYHGHELTLVDGEAMWIEGDATRLEQIFSNLLTNACKYTPTGGKINVAAKRDHGDVVVTVSDSGIGINRDMLPDVFDLFTQANRALDRSEGGLGIGLTVVKRLVELHGGSIAAHSEGEGRGSEFMVRLPESRQPNATESETKKPATETSQSRRILIVDDNPDCALGLGMLLKATGHTVRVGHSGPEALELAKVYRPDIILLDIGLPGMDGYQVARKLRHEPQFAHTGLVAISGYGQEEDRRRTADAGFDHHLVKPVDHATLLALLGKLA